MLGNIVDMWVPWVCFEPNHGGRVYFHHRYPWRQETTGACCVGLSVCGVRLHRTLHVLQLLNIGGDTGRIYPVKIAESESVSSLKRAIRAETKPEFDHIPRLTFSHILQAPLTFLFTSA